MKEGRFSDIKDLVVKAEALMDTVSAIRGKMGRAPLEEKDKTYFMKRHVKVNQPENSGDGKHRHYEFILEATEDNEKLLDSYTGVEFSIVYKVIATFTDKQRKPQKVEFEFCVNCPGAGIKVDTGK